MSLPPTPEPRDEADDLYRRASAADPSRPPEALRRRVLEHAAQLAAERTSGVASVSARARGAPLRSPRWWRPAAMFGTLAAAVVAGLMIAPRFLVSPGAPTSRPPVASAVQAERRDSHLAAGAAGVPAPASEPPAMPESLQAVPSAPSVPAEPAAYAPFSRPQAALAAKSTQERREAQGGAVVTPPSQAVSADASVASNADRVSGLTQEVTVTGARRAAMAPPAAAAAAGANVTDSAAAFRRAAENGDLGGLDRLLADQGDINARDSAGRTPLMLAVLHGQTEVVSALLAYGADPNAADSHGTTPLEAARASGRPAITAALQRYGARH